MIPFSKLWLPIALSSIMLSGCQDTNTVNDKPLEDKSAHSVADTAAKASQETAQKAAANNKLKADRTFDYTPKNPVNGTKMGVGAVGSSELTSLVIEVDDKGNWKLLDRKDNKSLVAENLAAESEIKVDLKRYLDGMYDEGVAKNNMHFVISSGAQQKGNADALIDELKSSGYVINIIDAKQEGKYAFQATVPPEYRENSFMVDIGSGNTKVSWQQDGELYSLETYGSKYFNDNIKNAQVSKEVKKVINTIPVSNQKNAFIIGGVPYHLAKRIRADDERYVVLNKPTSYQSDSKQAESGLNIYKAMAEETGNDTKYIFDFDSHYAIGFLASLK